MKKERIAELREKSVTGRVGPRGIRTRHPLSVEEFDEIFDALETMTKSPGRPRKSPPPEKPEYRTRSSSSGDG